MEAKLAELVKEISKKYGKQTVWNSNEEPLEVIPTGSFWLDKTLGINGFPKGRIVEIFGNESSGKTTIALQTVKECLKNNQKVLYVDAENALDGNYLKALGIDPNQMIIVKPIYGEQAFSIIDQFISTGEIALVVVDSVAALVPKTEMEATYQEQQMGLHARLMAKGIRMIQSKLATHNTCILFINQIREKIGVVFGNNETTTGGRSLRFFSSIRLEVKRAELIKNQEAIVGIRSKIHVVKNKLGTPFQKCYIDLYFHKGYNKTNEIITYAIDQAIIKKAGNWYYLQEEKIAQGKSNLETYFLNNPQAYQLVENLIINQPKE